MRFNLVQKSASGFACPIIQIYFSSKKGYNNLLIRRRGKAIILSLVNHIVFVKIRKDNGR